MSNSQFSENDISDMKQASMNLKGGVGAVAWAVLEMFRRAEMPQDQLKQLHQTMKEYFGRPSNPECNAILRVVEQRLKEDKISEKDFWYP